MCGMCSFRTSCAQVVLQNVAHTFFAYSQANNYFWLLQALGRSKEEYVLEAQSKTKNAQKAALAAAFNYFRSQLETDQSTWDALQMRLADRN